MRNLMILALFLVACDNNHQPQEIVVKVEVRVETPTPTIDPQEDIPPEVRYRDVVLLDDNTKKAYYTITNLLKEEFVNVEDEATQCHLLQVASEVGLQSEFYKFNPVRLITIGFNESRFGVNEYKKGTFPISASGDCGIYQQQPQFAVMPSRRTCDSFGSIALATEQAILFVRENIIKKHKAFSTTKLDDKICHYNSGNVCNGTKEYVKQHKETRAKADKFYNSVPSDFALPRPTCKAFDYEG